MGMHTTIHGKNSTPANGADGTWQPIKVNAAGQIEMAALNGELAQFNRLAGGAIASYVNLTANGSISTTPAILYGYTVTTATSAVAINVYDNTTNSGTILFTIPASTAVGQYLFPVGVLTNIGAYAQFGAATGTVNFVAVASS